MKWIILAYFITSIIPLSKSDHWLIRVWDFPRLQLLVLALLIGVIFVYSYRGTRKLKTTFLFVLLTGIGIDLYRILPYTFFWPKETIQTEPKDRSQLVSILTSNVLQSNEDASQLQALIEKKSPDLVFLLETNHSWIRRLSFLEKSYPYRLTKPIENKYGLAFYSKLEFKTAEVRMLINKDIPSVYAKLKLRSGQEIELYGVHPRPPHYKTGDTTERDAELIQVAKRVSKTSLPVIVMGDLNDVAWSHTTRLFRRISNLLDPRIGRGYFPTFPTYLPFLRFPLDHVFHSDQFTLVSIERLSDIGSDHYPIYIQLNLDPAKEVLQEGLSDEPGDEKEALKTLQRARKDKNRE